MLDCGETVPSVHRCGECGDDTFGVADLEKLAIDFDGADWPNGSASSFVEWMRMLPVLRAYVGAPVAAHDPEPLGIDWGEEEDDDPLAS